MNPKESEITSFPEGKKESVMTEHKHTNELINETSPYLLQHAHNPVNWQAWNEETLKQAKEEDKMLLISIGYAACHWCHVMEHESFENEEVAKIMNDNFIPVKIDREERPDIDQIYMSAIQAMGQNGGWPLNFFALPDGRPFWGGTYFPKDSWTNILQKVANEYANNKDSVIVYSERLTAGIIDVDKNRFDVQKGQGLEPKKLLSDAIAAWKGMMDNTEGGPKRERNKFPMPNAYQYLLKYGHANNDDEVLEHVHLSLKKMAFGGIYDQIGGGFSRYSVDKYWKAPHFEKMLYDNAQLVSLYSEAYASKKTDLYKDVVYETLEFVQRELTDKSGAFYASLDADSEGEEGKFYVWSKNELQEVLGEDFDLVKAYYNVNELGLWEHGNYILLRDKEDVEITEKFNINKHELSLRLEKVKSTLLNYRAKRIRPGLDDKILTSWNLLMCSAYLDSYRVFKDPKFLERAKVNVTFIEKNLFDKDGTLYHNYKNGRKTIPGFLEDYAHLIEAYVKFYQVELNENWLQKADALTALTIKEFFSTEENLFYFTSNSSEQLVARKIDIDDNVIPSANSVMAKNLFLLSYFMDKPNYEEKATAMLQKMKGQFLKYPLGYANWMDLSAYQIYNFYQVAVVGPDFRSIIEKMDKKYLPYKIILGAKNGSELPILKNKYTIGQTNIYVCQNKSCQIPTTDITKALQFLK